jgi:hypothetical protein
LSAFGQLFLESTFRVCVQEPLYVACCCQKWHISPVTNKITQDGTVRNEKKVMQLKTAKEEKSDKNNCLVRF